MNEESVLVEEDLPIEPADASDPNETSEFVLEEKDLSIGLIFEDVGI